MNTQTTALNLLRLVRSLAVGAGRQGGGARHHGTAGEGKAHDTALAMLER